MSKNTPTAIRLTRTEEVEQVLKVARKHYPALNDPEIFKLALSRLIYEPGAVADDVAELEAMASYAVGLDYLSDPAEDIYHEGMGKKVSF
jgi:hypothetical protein